MILVRKMILMIYLSTSFHHLYHQNQKNHSSDNLIILNYDSCEEDDFDDLLKHKFSSSLSSKSKKSQFRQFNPSHLWFMEIILSR